MKPWVYRLFIQLLPKVLFIERPKSGDSVDDEEDELKPPEGVLTGVFDVPSDMEKYFPYGGKRFSADYDIPALPPSRFEMAAPGDGPCFGEPPLPLPGADDDLFGPGTGCVAGAAGVCSAHDHSPTFDKPSHEMEKTIEDARFIAQHVRNKDKFQNVSKNFLRFKYSFHYEFHMLEGVRTVCTLNNNVFSL